MKSMVCVLVPAVVAFAAADARATPDPDEFDWSSSTAAPAPAPPQPARPRTWDFGVRATSGVGWLTRIPLCLFSTDCTDDTRRYALFGALAYLALGRLGSHVRWKTSLEWLYGPATSDNFGSMSAGRLLTGGQYLSDPRHGGGLLVELAGGLSYYGLPASSDASAPMLAASFAAGVRVERVELLGRVSFDTFLFEYMATATISLGYAFDVAD